MKKEDLICQCRENLAVPGLQIWSAQSCISLESCVGFLFLDIKDQVESSLVKSLFL